MKKFIFSVAVLFTAIFTVNAQTSYIIPKVGVAFSKAGGSDAKNDNESKFNAGFLGGAAFEIGVTETFAIQPELLYIQKGGKSSKYDVKSYLGYIEIPVLFKFYAGPVYFNAGPYVAFGLKEKDKGSGASVSQSFKDAGLNSTDAGLALGLGVAFEAGPGKIVLDARYDHGLLKLPKESGTGDKIFNRTIAISLGYAIPLGGK